MLFFIINMREYTSASYLHRNTGIDTFEWENKPYLFNSLLTYVLYAKVCLCSNTVILRKKGNNLMKNITHYMYALA